MTKPSLLIVEDDKVQQKLYALLCQRFNYDCVLLDKVSDAMELLRAEPSRFDCIILDWSIGEERGLDYIGMLRQEVTGRQNYLPIIMITAHAMHGDRKTCLESGADDYLPKPFTLEQFQEIIDRWVARVRSSHNQVNMQEWQESHAQETEKYA